MPSYALDGSHWSARFCIVFPAGPASQRDVRHQSHNSFFTLLYFLYIGIGFFLSLCQCICVWTNIHTNERAHIPKGPKMITRDGSTFFLRNVTRKLKQLRPKKSDFEQPSKEREKERKKKKNEKMKR